MEVIFPFRSQTMARHRRFLQRKWFRASSRVRPATHSVICAVAIVVCCCFVDAVVVVLVVVDVVEVVQGIFDLSGGGCCGVSAVLVRVVRVVLAEVVQGIFGSCPLCCCCCCCSCCCCVVERNGKGVLAVGSRHTAGL